MAGRQRHMPSPPPPSNSSPALPRHGPPEGNSSEAVVMETYTRISTNMTQLLLSTSFRRGGIIVAQHSRRDMITKTVVTKMVENNVPQNYFSRHNNTIRNSVHCDTPVMPLRLFSSL